MTAPGDKTLIVAPPTGGVTQEERPQYLRGFDGIASEAFPEATRKVLAEPVNPDDVEIKPDGIVFLPGVAWRRILTRAFGAGGWAIAPRGPARVMGNLVVYPGALYALGRFVADAVGECFYREGNSNMSYASCVEGAKTDCIGRCAKDTGYGAEMWDANWREQWKAKYATTYQTKDRDGKPKTMWKLKHRMSNPHDLMAGAGGVAPPAGVPPKTSSSQPATSSPTQQPTAATATSSAAPSAVPGPQGASTATPLPVSAVPASGSASPKESVVSAAPGSSPSPEPQTDTPTASVVELSAPYDAALAEKKAYVRAAIVQLKWTKAFVRLTFRQWHGETVGTAGNPIEALTLEQAEATYLLLKMYGGDGYDALVAELRTQGRIR